jgi:hypothetical protein
MSFNNLSAAQSVETKNKPADKAAPAADQPTTPTEAKPAEVGPPPRS